MKRSMVKSIVGIVVMALLSSYAVPMNAQATAAPCGVDLSQAATMMAQAQAKASSGDTDGALALLNQVSQAISHFKTSCPASSGMVDLPQTFFSVGGIYQLNYPSGWIPIPLPESSSSTPKQQMIMFSSEQAVFDDLKNSTPLGTAQAVIVYVGTAQQIVDELVVRQLNVNYQNMTALSLAQAVVPGQDYGGLKFSEAQKSDPINSHETATAVLTFMHTNGTTPFAKGQILIVQFGDDKFAMLLSMTGPDQPDTVTAIARSIAATMHVPATK